MFQTQTTSETITTSSSVTASSGPDDNEITVTQMVQKQTATTIQAIAGEKRKRDDAVDIELAEAIRPRKKPTTSSYSNPAGRTRSQLKTLAQVS